MAILLAGQSVQINIGEDSGIWANCTGVGDASFEFNNPAQIQLTSEYKRIGFYGIPVTVTLSCVSGQIEYLTSQPLYNPLKAIQGGDQDDSSALDVKLNVNGLQSGSVPFDGITLKNLPQTSGAPAGYGDLSYALSGANLPTYRQLGAVKVGGGMVDNSLFKDRTRQANILLKAMPKRVRIHLLNSSTITGLSGVAASIAPTANLMSAPLPSGGIGAFTAFTFPVTTAPAASGTAGDNATPSVVKSNWLDVTALPRDDGGSGYIFMVRCYQDAASSGTQMTIGNTTQMTDFAQYQVTCHYAQANGNFITSATTMTANANMQPFFLECEYEVPVSTVAIVGDSIMAGANAGPAATGSAASGAAFKAIKQITDATGKRVSLFNAGWSGASTTGGSGSTIPSPVRGYYGQFLAYLASGARPTIAAFCPWSVNNTLSYYAGQVTAVTDISNRFIALCSEYGIRPALVTPAPRNGITQAEESVRRQCVQAIKTVAEASGAILIDRDAVYTDYSSLTGGYKLPEWCLDNVHPTEAGHLVESAEWKAKLSLIL